MLKGRKDEAHGAESEKEVRNIQRALEIQPPAHDENLENSISEEQAACTFVDSPQSLLTAFEPVYLRGTCFLQSCSFPQECHQERGNGTRHTKGQLDLQRSERRRVVRHLCRDE